MLFGTLLPCSIESNTERKELMLFGTLLPCSIESNTERKELMLLAHYFFAV